jgi:hypothetical protein
MSLSPHKCRQCHTAAACSNLQQHKYQDQRQTRLDQGSGASMSCVFLHAGVCSCCTATCCQPPGIPAKTLSQLRHQDYCPLNLLPYLRIAVQWRHLCICGTRSNSRITPPPPARTHRIDHVAILITSLSSKPRPKRLARDQQRWRCNQQEAQIWRQRALRLVCNRCFEDSPAKRCWLHGSRCCVCSCSACQLWRQG